MLFTRSEQKLGSVGAICGCLWAAAQWRHVLEWQWKHFILNPGRSAAQVGKPGGFPTADTAHANSFSPSLPLFTCQEPRCVRTQKMSGGSWATGKVFVQDLGRVVPDWKHSPLANTLWISFTNRECKQDNRCIKSAVTPAPPYCH